MLAQEEARRLSHNFVGTEQILLGLIGEGSGAAAMTLKSYGVTLKDARIEVEKIIGQGSDLVAVEIPFTPRAKRLLELSWRHAKDLGDKTVCTEHLLMGLLDAGDSVAIKVLKNLGVGFLARRYPQQMSYFRREVAEPILNPFEQIFSLFLGKKKEARNLSLAVRKTLEVAQSGARSAGHIYAGSDSITACVAAGQGGSGCTSAGRKWSYNKRSHSQN